MLLDECVPRKLKRELAEHQVLTVTEQGWSGITNGQLLTLAEAEFDVFLTGNQNNKYRQNLTASRIAIILLVARNNRLKTLLAINARSERSFEERQDWDFVQVGKS